MQGSKLVSGRYTKGVPFLSKMVYKRLRDRTTRIILCRVCPSPLWVEHLWLKYCGGFGALFFYT